MYRPRSLLAVSVVLHSNSTSSGTSAPFHFHFENESSRPIGRRGGCPPRSKHAHFHFDNESSRPRGRRSGVRRARSKHAVEAGGGDECLFRTGGALRGTQRYEMGVVVGVSILDAFLRLLFVVYALTGSLVGKGYTNSKYKVVSGRRNVVAHNFVKFRYLNLWTKCFVPFCSKQRLCSGDQKLGEAKWDEGKQRTMGLSQEVMDQVKAKVAAHSLALFDDEPESWFKMHASETERQYVLQIRDEFLQYLEVQEPGLKISSDDMDGINGKCKWWFDYDDEGFAADVDGECTQDRNAGRVLHSGEDDLLAGLRDANERSSQKRRRSDSPNQSSPSSLPQTTPESTKILLMKAEAFKDFPEGVDNWLVRPSYLDLNGSLGKALHTAMTDIMGDKSCLKNGLIKGKMDKATTRNLLKDFRYNVFGKVKGEKREVFPASLTTKGGQK